MSRSGELASGGGVNKQMDTMCVNTSTMVAHASPGLQHMYLCHIWSLGHGGIYLAWGRVSLGSAVIAKV